MSLPKVTQDNVHIFIPLKAAKVSYRFAKRYGLSSKQALLNFYNSKVYDILEQEDTKLWYEGVNYLYMGLEMEKDAEKLDI